MFGKFIFCAVLCLSLNQACLARPGLGHNPKTARPVDVRPTSPAEPAKPEESPFKPVEPEDPFGPPLNPVNPVESAEPEEPVEPPFKPMEPEGPVEPSEPVEPVDPVKPVEPSKPVDPVEPVEPSKPVEPVDPVEPAEPSKPVEPVEPVKPQEPEQPQAVSVCRENLKQLGRSLVKVFELLYMTVSEIFQGLFRIAKCASNGNFVECSKQALNTTAQNTMAIFADYEEKMRDFGSLAVSSFKICLGLKQLQFVEPFIYGYNVNF